jgi:hypothetical protein
MKTLFTSLAVVVLVASSSAAFAEGSKIERSTIENSANNSRATTRAQGGFLGAAEASTGSVIVKGGSSVKNSTIKNSSNNANSTTSATGGFLGKATAHTGSVVVSD